MNKATTNCYFPFFGVPYHLILDGKISRRENYLESFLFLEGGWGGGGGGRGEWGAGAGVIFGPRIFFGLVGKPTSLC